LHVISTFLSREESEEVQIKGRTARQGNNGTFNLVLLDEDLKEFDINDIEVRQIEQSDDK
jgi:preprotein translocase subunit SecA